MVDEECGLLGVARGDVRRTEETHVVDPLVDGVGGRAVGRHAHRAGPGCVLGSERRERAHVGLPREPALRLRHPEVPGVAVDPREAGAVGHLVGEDLCSLVQFVDRSVAVDGTDLERCDRSERDGGEDDEQADGHGMPGDATRRGDEALEPGFEVHGGGRCGEDGDEDEPTVRQLTSDVAVDAEDPVGRVQQGEGEDRGQRQRQDPSVTVRRAVGQCRRHAQGGDGADDAAPSALAGHEELDVLPDAGQRERRDRAAQVAAERRREPPPGRQGDRPAGGGEEHAPAAAVEGALDPHRQEEQRGEHGEHEERQGVGEGQRGDGQRQRQRASPARGGGGGVHPLDDQCQRQDHQRHADLLRRQSGGERPVDPATPGRAGSQGEHAGGEGGHRSQAQRTGEPGRHDRHHDVGRDQHGLDRAGVAEEAEAQQVGEAGEDGEPRSVEEEQLVAEHRRRVPGVEPPLEEDVVDPERAALQVPGDVVAGCELAAGQEAQRPHCDQEAGGGDRPSQPPGIPVGAGLGQSLSRSTGQGSTVSCSANNAADGDEPSSASAARITAAAEYVDRSSAGKCTSCGYTMPVQ